MILLFGWSIVWMVVVIAAARRICAATRGGRRVLVRWIRGVFFG